MVKLDLNSNDSNQDNNGSKNFIAAISKIVAIVGGVVGLDMIITGLTTNSSGIFGNDGGLKLIFGIIMLLFTGSIIVIIRTIYDACKSK